jgi:hypothetical protein
MRQIYKQQLQVLCCESFRLILAEQNIRLQNLATRDAAQEHRYFNPHDDFLGLENLLAFQPYRARELVTGGGDFDFRIQKDTLRRLHEEGVSDDLGATTRSLADGDDFGVLTVATQAMNDAGRPRAMFCDALRMIDLIMKRQVSIPMQHRAFSVNVTRNQTRTKKCIWTPQQVPLKPFCVNCRACNTTYMIRRAKFFT